jgi:hypothetical protein
MPKIGFSHTKQKNIMSVKDLKKKLNNILTKDESVVVSINGKWGVGKTYFFSSLLSLSSSSFKIITTLQFFCSFSSDINPRTSSNSIAKHIKDITIPYIGIGITLPDKQDFKDIIVCFDDFERLSSSMELEEVLGFISELKEQKNCSVVMNLNEDELSDKFEYLKSFLYQIKKHKPLFYLLVAP